MASSERPTDTNTRPAGVEGDGMDPYPTYHDRPGSRGKATGSKPTDVNLPRSRRTYALPILIGLIVFALVIIVRIFWGSMNMAVTTDDAMTPGDAASPPAAEAPTASGAAPAAPVPLDEEQPQTNAGPGEVEPTPGAVDVPGGDTTTPAGQPAAPQ
jgi:hypothetical protein